MGRRGITIEPLITEQKDKSLQYFFKDIAKIKSLSAEEEAEIAEKIKNGDKKALDKLIVSNLKFVVSVAKKYQNKGLPLVDLIQSGVEGLIKASKEFNPLFKCKFISFAVWYIRQSIFESLNNNSRIVRPSFQQILLNSKINKISEKFMQEYNYEPSNYDLENYINIESNKLDTALMSTCFSHSLEDTKLIDYIEDDNLKSDSGLNKEDIHNELLKYINKLPKRDALILKHLYGIGVEKLSKDDISKLTGVTNCRLNILIKEAIKKLKSRYSKQLKDLL